MYENSIFPLVLEFTRLNGSKSYANATGFLINETGRCITASHFVFRNLTIFGKEKEKVKHYEKRKRVIELSSVSNFVKKMSISKLEYNEKWMNEFNIYALFPDKIFKFDKEKIHARPNHDVSCLTIIDYSGNFTGFTIGNTVLTKTTTMNIYGFTYSKGGKLDISSYNFENISGKYEGTIPTTLKKHGIKGTFGVLSEGASEGVSGGPVIYNGEVYGLQSMTTNLGQNGKATSVSKSLFSDKEIIKTYVKLKIL